MERKATMGRPKVADGKPLSIRLDTTTRDRLEALQTTLEPGLEVTLAQVVRAALVRGLEALEGAAGSGKRGRRAP